MDSQIIEIIGLNRLVNDLLAAGVEVARPIRDRGVDLIAYIERDKKSFWARPIQLKAASEENFIINKKYSRATDLLLVYYWHLHSKNHPVAYAMSYATAVQIAAKMGYTKNATWTRNGIWTVHKPGRDLKVLMEPYQMNPDRWKKAVFNSMA